jgi:hypothetical protein
MQQISESIFMVRPAHFGYNEQTAESNSFQNIVQDITDISLKAIAEFDTAVATLKEAGIEVWVIEDTTDVIKPDAIFPNNWISTHEDGTIVIYPMLTPNRRAERRNDVVEKLQAQYQVSKLVDLSNYESQRQFLEGTGSIVFDHEARLAYACLSPRTDLPVLQHLCREIGYQPIVFHSEDEYGKAIYHTNVIMGMGMGFVVICLESVKNKQEQELLVKHFEQSDKEIIDISFEQVKFFAGNVLALKNNNDLQVLALSLSALNVLTDEQKKQLDKYCQILPLNIPTIETIGGGSVRCMMAQNFLKKL